MSVGGPAAEVTTTTLGLYAERAGLDQLALVEIGTEAMASQCCGARELFAGQRISVAQSEFNQGWLHRRCYLRDAFELVEPPGYQVSKLTPACVEFDPSWDPELRPS